MSVAVLQRHRIGIDRTLARIRMDGEGESLTSVVRKVLFETTGRLGRQVVLNRVMDEFGRRAKLKFAEKSASVGADGLDAEGDLVSNG
jgi:hypothetical protein